MTLAGPGRRTKGTYAAWPAPRDARIMGDALAGDNDVLEYV